MDNRFVDVDGVRLRYFEAGSGAAVLLLHGGSLGSSADVFSRIVPRLADAGLRAIAFDQPGFGLSAVPADHSTHYRRESVPRLMDALGLRRAALMAHSQAGGAAVQLALADPARYSHVVILSTGSLLPPAAEAGGAGSRPAREAAPREWQAGDAEPTLADTRRALEETVFNHALITEDAVALRHSHSLGRNYRAFLARQALGDEGGGKGGTPLWQRLTELSMPLLMIYGRQDRARAAERAEHLKRLRPEIDLHIVDGCKHMLPWDAEDELIRLAVPHLQK